MRKSCQLRWGVPSTFAWDDDDECWRYGSIAVMRWHSVPWVAEMQDRDSFPVLSASGRTRQAALDVLWLLLEEVRQLQHDPFLYRKEGGRHDG